MKIGRLDRYGAACQLRPKSFTYYYILGREDGDLVVGFKEFELDLFDKCFPFLSSAKTSVTK
jgi:hypothetical protein